MGESTFRYEMHCLFQLRRSWRAVLPRGTTNWQARRRPEQCEVWQWRVTREARETVDWSTTSLYCVTSPAVCLFFCLFRCRIYSFSVGVMTLSLRWQERIQRVNITPLTWSNARDTGHHIPPPHSHNSRLTYQQSYSTLSPVNTGMGDRFVLWVYHLGL